ncbi:regulatory protein LuxO [bacterium BMS3Bbin02]|nr:regulatory protein LuxO [bacterium BMS3Bbin02]
MSDAGSLAPSLLIIEDNPLHLRLVQAMLAEAWPEGLPTVNVNRLQVAIRHLRSSEAEVDCVLLDLVLPDSDGIDSVRQILTAAPNVPIVVLSAHDDQDAAVQAVAEGAEDYLVKGSIGPATLSRTIRFAVARHRGVRPAELYGSRDGHCVVDRNGVIVYTDRGLAGLFDTNVEEIVGSSFAELVGPQNAAALAQDTAFSSVIEGGPEALAGKHVEGTPVAGVEGAGWVYVISSAAPGERSDFLAAL